MRVSACVCVCESVCVCVCPDNFWTKMTFDLDIWLAGSSWHYPGQVRRSKFKVIGGKYAKMVGINF